MKNYIFEYNKKNGIEKVKLIYTENNTIYCKYIGDIYSVAHYINNNIDTKTKIDFLNFTENKLKYLINTIIKYQKIERINNYNSLVINIKKRIRGK